MSMMVLYYTQLVSTICLFFMDILSVLDDKHNNRETDRQTERKTESDREIMMMLLYYTRL